MLSKMKAKTTVIISTTIVTIVVIRSVYLLLNRKKKEVEKLENEEEEVQSVQKDLPMQLSTHDSLPQHIEREVKKEQRRKTKMKDLAMKSPMYDNVRLMAPDGELLSTISEKKGKWYVSKNLGRWTDKNQNCIQLLFEPKARASEIKDVTDGKTMEVYNKTQKRNECVVCGSIENMVRHYIVPYGYRSLLPKKYKSHMSHDIVILCGNCNFRCQQQYQMRMNEIEDSLRPIGTKNKYEVNHELYHLRSCSLALLRWKDKLPPEKVHEYEHCVRKYLDSLPNALNTKESEPLTQEILQKIINIEYKVKNSHYIAGADLVVNHLGNNDETIEQFVKTWRQYFLDLAHPRNLPSGWSVDNPVASER